MKGVKARYRRAWDDRQYLWSTYGPADDMTGGRVDQTDLDRLLRVPTLYTATKILEEHIEYWFQKGPESPIFACDDSWKDDPRARAIKERYVDAA